MPHMNPHRHTWEAILTLETLFATETTVAVQCIVEVVKPLWSPPACTRRLMRSSPWLAMSPPCESLIRSELITLMTAVLSQSDKSRASRECVACLRLSCSRILDSFSDESFQVAKRLPCCESSATRPYVATPSLAQASSIA